jgi:hypothetical protein
MTITFNSTNTRRSVTHQLNAPRNALHSNQPVGGSHAAATSPAGPPSADGDTDQVTVTIFAAWTLPLLTW